MAATDDIIKPKGYCASDIERTGKGLVDVTFAIGWSHSDQSLKNITSGQICYDFGLNLEEIDKMDHEEKVKTIRKFWKFNGYEMRCFDEFWSKNIDTFISIQHIARSNVIDCESMSNVIHVFNEELKKIEAKYSQLNIITDTTMFDTVWLNHLLLEHGYAPLNYDRSGKKYRWGYETDSYALGALGCTPEDDWKKYDDLLKEKIDSICPEITAEHDHIPKNDAKSILIRFLKTMKYCASIREYRVQNEQDHSPKRIRQE